MKKVVKVSGTEVKAMVQQIIAESNKNKKTKRISETTYGKGMSDQFHDDNADTKWHVGPGNPNQFDKTLRSQSFDQYVEKFGPVTVKIVDGQKVACIGNRCYDANDNLISETTRRKKSRRTIRLTESEMIEFLDKLATRVENSRRRRGLK